MAEKVTFFKKQEKVHPRDIWGFYRQLKWLAMAILLAIYYFTPWIRWDRGAHVPDQAVLIDMAGRRAYFFGIEIWPQEVYYLTGLLILAAIGLFFVTSLFGRVWCGYACPQTVWTDLFIKVEHFIQGDRNARMKLDKGSLTFEKIWKKGLTHFIWLVIGLCTGGAWVFYFSDAPTLMDQIIHFQVPLSTSIWIFGLTFSTYIMAGYAREQVCTYMCPYSRFQSAMFDRDTLLISYDVARGEPRGSHKQGDSWENRGHCIDCGQCVAVCPTGIDIRKGLQLECIACGLCVDVCNSVMKKVDLPGGLIRYDTERNQKARDHARAHNKSFKPRSHIFRMRTFYYLTIMLVVGSVMLFSLLNRASYDLHVLHDRNPLYVKLSSGDVRNSYTIKILNKTHADHAFKLTVEGLPQATIGVVGAGNPNAENLVVLADSVAQYRVLLTLPADMVDSNRRDISFKAVEVTDGSVAQARSMFVTREDR